MGVRTVLVALVAVGILLAARAVCSRPLANSHAPASASTGAQASTSAPAALPAVPATPTGDSPASLKMDQVVRAVGEAPHEVALGEGARMVFESALAAQDLGGSVDLAASVATDPEMRQAILGEASRRLPTAQGELRCRLLAVLAALGDPQGFALWKSALASDPDARSRELLARHPMTQPPFAAEALEAVLDRVRSDREATVRRAALEGLPAGLSKERMDVFLAAIAGDADPSVRRAALAYLSEDARGDERLAVEAKRIVGDEAQDRQVRLLASAILRDARRGDAVADPTDPQAKPNDSDLDRSMPPAGR